MAATRLPDTEIVEDVYNHIALPAHLPTRQDSRIDKIEGAVFDRVLNASVKLSGLFPDDGSLISLYRSLKTSRRVNMSGRLSKASLLSAFKELKSTHFILIHVAEQNAALVLRRQESSRGVEVTFEGFEVSALTEPVLASKAALLWDFPGSSAAIPCAKFDEPDFQEELATMLEKASTESIKYFAPRAFKGMSSAYESRQTVDPSFITQLLVTLLEVNGRRIFPTLLRKRVKDEVNWKEGGKKPWRRSPLWFALRATTQQHLYAMSGKEPGRVQYKFLICLVHSRLLDDLALLDDKVDRLQNRSEMSSHLNTKMCRRLVKLGVERGESDHDLTIVYETLFRVLGPIFQQSTKSATARISTAWERFKQSTTRRIPILSHKARWSDLSLSLRKSSRYLSEVLAVSALQYTMPQYLGLYHLPQDYQSSSDATRPAALFTNRYLSLYESEEAIASQSGSVPLLGSNVQYRDRSEKLAKQIEGYLDNVSDAYDQMPEQQSFMLLNVMELWMEMDMNAVKAFELLKDFDPVFPVNVLDVLQVPRLRDMIRLQKIRKYLEQRHASCNDTGLTIFSNPDAQCFAARYYTESGDAPLFDEIRQRIEEWGKRLYNDKKKDLKRKRLQFEALKRRAAATTCTLSREDSGYMRHNPGKCTKCYHERCVKRFTVKGHEDPLPEDTVQAKIALFEIGCPRAFSAYRNSTWRILSTLALPKSLPGDLPPVTLKVYIANIGLKHYSISMPSRFCLVSTVKSWLLTHYSDISLPADMDKLCHTNGLKLEYYDESLKSWAGRLTLKPSFAHHCRMTLPAQSPYSSLNMSTQFDMTGPGPTSYEVIASQTKCPSGLNTNEFLAFQGLFGGKTRRWPQLLLELASSNVNFGTEAARILTNHLSSQMGPPDAGNTLGAVHNVFGDDAFCHRLLDQLQQRLDAIASNWREINSMEILTTIGLRLFELGITVRDRAVEFLLKVRAVSADWISVLKLEIRSAVDADSAQRFSSYAFWAALLCRRTFSIHANQQTYLDPVSICCFLETAICVQDNMVADPATLAHGLKLALVRDLQMLAQICDIVRDSLENNQSAFMSFMCSILPDVEGMPSRRFSGFQFLSAPHSMWIQMIIDATEHSHEQVVHFSLLEGHLLIMGKPVGKLPPDWRKSIVVQQLFGNQSLLTYPSALPGMTYMLAVPMYGNAVHLGFRHGVLVVQTCLGNEIFELIPREIFGDSASFDLPASLVDNCNHWMNIRTGLIEIRTANPWVPRMNSWYLDFYGRQASRPRPSPTRDLRHTSTLVDTHCPLFKAIARIFDKFEDSRQLGVMQPGLGRLTVFLRRLELTFFVNTRGMLQCPQLNAEIDTNQDAGTWYGLQSKIVLKEVVKKHDRALGTWSFVPLRQRIILTCLGGLSYSRFGPHVTTVASTGTSYGRFIINDVIGRLDCAPEPRLLYAKAAYHAYTSFMIPDPLTGRTGTEEAVHCLSSGYCQPWAPITPGAYPGLQIIAALTPGREYYPNNELKFMQMTTWNDQLTTIIQHDEFHSLVRQILVKSEELSKFSLQEVELPPLESAGEQHLVHRSQLRRECYLRPTPSSTRREIGQDHIYSTRDRPQLSQNRDNLVECVSLLNQWPSNFSTTQDLAGILQGWSSIENFGADFDKILLTDVLELQWTSDWTSLVKLCCETDRTNLYQLMFLLATVSFHEEVDMDAIRVLIAFIIFKELKVLSPPTWLEYTNFKHNKVPLTADILGWVRPYHVPYEGDDNSETELDLGFKLRKKRQSAKSEYEQQQQKDAKLLATFLLKQWPCAEPSMDGFTATVLIDLDIALPYVLQEWLRMYQNMQLSDYVSQVQLVLDAHGNNGNSFDHPVIVDEEQDTFTTISYGSEFFSLPQLLNKAQPSSLIIYNAPGDLQDPSLVSEMPPRRQILARSSGFPVAPPEIRELQSIIAPMARSDSNVEVQYVQDLAQSLVALQAIKLLPTSIKAPFEPAKLSGEIIKARDLVQAHLQGIQLLLEHDKSTQVYWQKQGMMWPCTKPVPLLENLREIANATRANSATKVLLDYALSITSLQRLLRMEDAHQKGNRQRYTEEQENLGHSNWNPEEYLDWVLLEIDANFLIRPGQTDVAFATIFPASGSNSVLQMNMGQGKTSCIMPMVAAVLADGRNLMRVVVPKSLLLQTAQLLHSRLGGLVGRELRHIPFSRRTPTGLDTTKALQELLESVQQSSGILLALPEHLLSFRLSGLQRLSDGRIEEAKEMINTQHWISQHARDVIDECDSILALRTQLIYPSGSQKAVDGHPVRWHIFECLLHLVDGHVEGLQMRYPQSIEIVRRQYGGYPAVFFLRKDVESALVNVLVDDIVKGRTSIFPVDCTNLDRDAIKEYISQSKVSSATEDYVSSMFPGKPALRQAIYLLRGLLVHRILLMALRKRWNVQYGLHPKRDPIAVPYHAKGTPSDQAEWGHPDVAILFTCLAFYYEGISPSHLRQTLEHVLKSDDPSQVYFYFVQTSTLPPSLREWSSINVDDEAQLTEIWVHVRHNVAVVDYFLNSFVFPRYAKQFQVKLQASGWDLPLESTYVRSPASGKTALLSSEELPMTTGFSGTNDGKRMLPLTICQQDLQGLSQTNAEVLTYLLQTRNRQYILSADHLGRHISENELLHKIHNTPGKRIRILIDAGAQILEMDNLSLVKAWLEIAVDAPAAVFFDESSRPMVVYRNNYGNQIPLAASPFAEDLGESLVYLDEAHTRGTDLKLPIDARGALTLGLGQSKDHTVQAAMRLRQLGTTQSVTFFAPPEVNQSILDLSKKRWWKMIDSSDVIRWLLEQTCRGLEQLQPMYYAQGADFCRRTQAELDFPDFITNLTHRASYLACLRQIEQQTLEQLYKPSSRAKPTKESESYSPRIGGFMRELKVIRKRFQDNGDAVHSSALQEVEQEREVAHEVEAVRELQRPVHYTALKFSALHRDITNFAKTGKLTADSGAYELAFSALRKFTLGKKHGVTSTGTSGRLYVSSEFMRTVDVPSGQRAYDNFQRPVSWILWSPSTDLAMIVIPEEAERLLRLIRTSTTVTHMLTYAAPVTRQMCHFDQLKYYAVPTLPSDWIAPSWLRVELGIFSGRLYFEYSEYDQILQFLGLQESGAGKKSDEDGSSDESPDENGLTKEKEISTSTNVEVFSRKPLAFLQEWLALRRRGQDFQETPMGFVCQGKPLFESQHFFRQPDISASQKVSIAKARASAAAVEEDEKDGGHAGDFVGMEFEPIQPDEERKHMEMENSAPEDVPAEDEDRV